MFIRHENGNVLFLILIAVALFAALSYAVTQSNRSGGGDASKENSTIQAATLIQYATGISGSITRLTASGICAPEQISFENPISLSEGNDFTNPDAPSNHSCHVFHPSGGNSSFQVPSAVLEYKGQTPGAHIIFSAVSVPGIGTSEPDLIFLVYGGIPRNTCTEINKKLGIATDGNTKPEFGTDGGPSNFIGDLGSGDNSVDLEFDTSYIYPPSFCAYDSEHTAEPNKGGFVHVLVPR